MRKTTQKKLLLPALLLFVCALFAGLSFHINVFARAETAISYNNVVALVNFSDTATKFDDSNSAGIKSVFNAQSESQTDGANLQSYLYTVSRGRVVYVSHFYIVDVPGTAASYKAWDRTGYSPLFLDALAGLNEQFAAHAPDVDFSHDNANLDGLTLYLNAETGDNRDNPDIFWPHQNTLANSTKKLADLLVSKYMVIPKNIENSAGENTFLQVICHETLHMFGADDLYHYTKNDGKDYENNPDGYQNLHPVGIWDIMGTAADYNQPHSVNTYYRYQNRLIGDDAFRTAQAGQSYSLQSSLSQTGLLGLKFGEKDFGEGHTEFFVLEKRDFNKSYDKAISRFTALKSGFTVYRVKTLTREGRDVMTGNRVADNGDEIVYFDKNCSADLTNRSVTFGAIFPATTEIDALVYSDGSTFNQRLVLAEGAASFEEILTDLRVKVSFGKTVLGADEFQVYANGRALAFEADEQTLVDGSVPLSAPRGSNLTFAAPGYVFEDRSIEVTDELTLVSVPAFKGRTLRFAVGDTPISGIAVTVGAQSGKGSQARTYTSGEDGTANILIAPGETASFAGRGFGFTPASFPYAEGTETVAISLEKQARTVVVSLGETVAGTVSVTVNDGQPQQLQVDENHRVTVAGVFNGDVLKFAKESFEFADVTVSHLVEDDAFSSETREFFELTGVVTSGGTPLANLEFSYTLGDETGTFTTDANGAFTLPRVERGLSFSVHAPGYFVKSVTIDAPELALEAQKLLTLESFWLAVPAVIFLLQVIFTMAHDYGRKRRKK